ncbi:MAG TPA: ADOP family duplicated permease [Gemmatimonadaceae bacterium]|nr:ADOP family duplicated permease [Gemmatimonadaceae bacterium]
MNAPRPPERAVRLLTWALPDDLRDAILGDLEESFAAHTEATLDLPRARRWYWREAILATMKLGFRGRRRAPSAERRDPLITSLLSDVRFAARLLARRPGFTALASITLAIGIGATTAIFSAIHPILLAPLPYPHAERIVQIWEGTDPKAPDNTTFLTMHDVAEQNRSFEAIAVYKSYSAIITGRGEPERVAGQRVSHDFFKVLGVRPTLGRDFRADEDVRDGPRVAIISDGLWRRRFGGDSAIVGAQVSFNGYQYTVIGVMPADFESIVDPTAQLWGLMQYDVSDPWACRTCHHLRAIARLKAGVSVKQANADLNALSAVMVRDHPKEYAKAGMLVIPLHEQVTAGVRPILLAVTGAVALLLLIACANVMNLLLARGAQRKGEFAMRAALGASRARVVRQLLTESVTLALVGGALGVAVAQLGVRALIALAPAGLPRLAAIEVDGSTMAFAIALTTAAGVAFGLVPALHASRSDLHESIKQGTRRAGGGSHLVRSSLVVGEVALALMLLVGAGLLVQSVRRLLAVAPGFDSSHLLTMQVGTVGPRYDVDSVTRNFFDRVLLAVRAVPGVEEAAFTSQLPLSGDFDMYGVHAESHPRANPEEDPSGHRYAVSPGYLETMRIPVVRGRSFDEHDAAASPAVVLVNESFAKKLWPGEDAIGQRIRVGSPTDGPWRTVVGIVGGVRQVSLAGDAPDAFYVPESQWPYTDGSQSLVVRARGDAAGLAGAVRSAVWSVDKDQPVTRVATMDRLIEQSAADRRFALTLFEAFALVALVLAAAGIYGVLAGAVTERVREIGVRAALGASRRDILAMILRQGLGLTGLGVAAGLALALVGVRVIAGLLYGVTVTDPATYAGVTAVLTAVAGAACLVPAWRAARVDPATTLRME